jgi:hypothetical protein
MFFCGVLMFEGLGVYGKTNDPFSLFRVKIKGL